MTDSTTEAQPVQAPSPRHTVTLYDGVADRLREMLAHAQAAACTIDQAATSYEDLARRQRKVIEHQHSLLSTLVRVIASTAYDGDVNLALDHADLSLFWSHPRTGYHGGLIFHEDGAHGYYGTHT